MSSVPIIKVEERRIENVGTLEYKKFSPDSDLKVENNIVKVLLVDRNESRQEDRIGVPEMFFPRISLTLPDGVRLVPINDYELLKCGYTVIPTFFEGEVGERDFVIFLQKHGDEESLQLPFMISLKAEKIYSINYSQARETRVQKKNSEIEYSREVPVQTPKKRSQFR